MTGDLDMGRWIAVLMVVAMGSTAGAATLTDWTAVDVETLVDADEGFLPGREILEANRRLVGGTQFFRIVLEAAPTRPTGPPPSFAGIYGIVIDSVPGGVDAAARRRSATATHYRRRATSSAVALSSYPPGPRYPRAVRPFEEAKGAGPACCGRRGCGGAIIRGILRFCDFRSNLGGGRAVALRRHVARGSPSI
jgi:hypothetical protein